MEMAVVHVFACPTLIELSPLTYFVLNAIRPAIIVRILEMVHSVWIVLKTSSDSTILLHLLAIV